MCGRYREARRSRENRTKDRSKKKARLYNTKTATPNDLEIINIACLTRSINAPLSGRLMLLMNIGKLSVRIAPFEVKKAPKMEVIQPLSTQGVMIHPLSRGPSP